MPEWPTMLLEDWGFEWCDIILTSGEERKSRGWVQPHGQQLNQSCPHNEISVKTPYTEAHMNFPDWQYFHILMLGRLHIPENDGSFTCVTLPNFSLCMPSLSWFSLVAFCYNKTIIISIALIVNSVSLFHELSKLGVVMGTPDVGQKKVVPWKPPNLWLVPEVRAVLWRTVFSELAAW